MSTPQLYDTWPGGLTTDPEMPRRRAGPTARRSSLPITFDLKLHLLVRTPASGPMSTTEPLHIVPLSVGASLFWMTAHNVGRTRPIMVSATAGSADVVKSPSPFREGLSAVRVEAPALAIMGRARRALCPLCAARRVPGHPKVWHSRFDRRGWALGRWPTFCIECCGLEVHYQYPPLHRGSPSPVPRGGFLWSRSGCK